MWRVLGWCILIEKLKVSRWRWICIYLNAAGRAVALILVEVLLGCQSRELHILDFLIYD